jgi:hypothetical protein
MKTFSTYAQNAFDSFDFTVSRRTGGLRGMELSLACRGGFGGLENAQTTQNEQVNNEQVSIQGGSGDSTTIGVGGQNNVANTTVNNYNADAGIIDAVSNGLATLAGQSESQAAQAEETDNLTVASLSNNLAAITANAAPQSAAAQQEIDGGSTPLGGSTATSGWSGFINSSSVLNTAVIGGAVLTAIVFLRSRGKSA